MQTTIIVARSKNGVIGKDGDLPWHLPEDLKRFKSLTTDHAIIMGRKTWDSIGRPLPNRQNIVITRDSTKQFEGATLAPTLGAALEIVEPHRSPFIIGGSEIYRLALDVTQTIEMTLIDAEVDGDTFFPDLNPNDWEEIKRSLQLDEKTQLRYAFITYQRKQVNVVR
jgi:dihydrofolate reductase